MALNQTIIYIYPEVVKTENKDLLDLRFRVDDNKNEIIEQKVIQNPTKRNEDNKDVTLCDGKLICNDDIKYSAENHHPHSTTEENFPKSAITTSQQLFTESKSDQRANEPDYYVIHDPDNATVFHIQFVPSDQDINRLRHWNSSIFYYGPEFKPCSVLLTDCQPRHRQRDSLEQLISEISGKHQILLQRIDPSIASDLTKKSDDSSAVDEDRPVASGDAEGKYSIGYSTMSAKDNTMSDAMTIDASNNCQQLFPLSSDSPTVSDRATMRRFNQTSIFYNGPELKSCFVPVNDFRVRRRRPNPLENMEFFAARPIRRSKRKSKKTK